MGIPFVRRPSLGTPFEPVPNGSPSPRPASYRTKPCRNFALGSCIYGDRCSYLHASPSYHVQPRLSPSQAYQAYPFPYSPTPCFEGYGYQGVPYLSSPPPEHVLSNLGPFASTPSEILVSVDDMSGYKTHTATPDAQDRTPPAPPCTPANADITESPQQFALPELSSASTSPSVSSPRERRGSRPPLPHRGFFYRTKPCRFFHETGSCVKGNRCNFIHEGYNSNASTENTVESRRGSITSVSSDATSTPSAASPSRKQRRAAKRAASQDRNFYPVTWRVIGGGVMMCGKRDICTEFMAGRCTEGDDCKFAHPETYGQAQTLLAGQWTQLVQEDVASEYFSQVPHLWPVLPMGYYAPHTLAPPPPPPVSSPPRKRAYALQVTLPEREDEPAKTYSPHRVLAGDTLQELAASTSMSKEPVAPVDDGLLSPGRFLVRPMSTPPTPAVKNTDTIRLFNAESP